VNFETELLKLFDNMRTHQENFKYLLPIFYLIMTFLKKYPNWNKLEKDFLEYSQLNLKTYSELLVSSSPLRQKHLTLSLKIMVHLSQTFQGLSEFQLFSKKNQRDEVDLNDFNGNGFEFMNKLRYSNFQNQHSNFSLEDLMKHFENSFYLEEIISNVILHHIVQTSKNEMNSGSRLLSNVILQIYKIFSRSSNSKAFHWGFLMDWFEVLQPSVIKKNGNSNIQASDFEIVFSQTKGMHNTIKSYLLNSLIHHSNWELLELCQSSLFNYTFSNSIPLDPTTSLNFLSACLRHPKSWNRTSEKISSFLIRDSLDQFSYHSLSYLEAFGIIDLIIQESLLSLSSLTMSLLQKKHIPTLERRISLISLIANQSDSILRGVISHLLSSDFKGGIPDYLSPRTCIVHQLLIQLYILYPDTIFMIPYHNVVHDLIRSYSISQTLTNWTGKVLFYFILF